MHYIQAINEIYKWNDFPQFDNSHVHDNHSHNCLRFAYSKTINNRKNSKFSLNENCSLMRQYESSLLWLNIMLHDKIYLNGQIKSI